FSHEGELLATSSWDSTCMLWKVTPVLQHDQKSTAHKSEPSIRLVLLMILPVHEEGASCLAFTVDDKALVTCGECVVKVWDISDAVANNQVDGDEASKTLVLDNQLAEWQQAIPYSFSIESSTNLFAFDEAMTTLVGNHEWLYCRDNTKVRTLLAPAQSENERNEVIDIKQCLEHIIDEIDPNDDEFVKQLNALEKSETKSNSSENDIMNGTRDNRNDTLALTTEETIRLKTQFRNMEDFDFEKLFTPALSLSLESNGTIDSITSKSVTRPAIRPDGNNRLLRTFSKSTKDGIFSSHSSSITGCVVAQDLDLVVTVALDKSIRYWSLEKGVVLEAIFDAHDAPITCCALTSPTTCDLLVYEMLLATGGSDNLVKVWRRNSPSRAGCVFSLSGHYDTIRSLAFDPSGVFLVSSSEDTAAIMWRVRPASPDQPEAPVVDVVNRFSITISWTEPLANGAKILNYIVRTTQTSSFLGDGSDIAIIPDVEVPAKYLSKIIAKLQPGVKYTLQVAAVNQIGTSKFSAATEPIETLAFIPSRIERAVQHDYHGATHINLSWTAPCPNGAAIESYTIHCRPENSEFVPLREVTIPVGDLKVSYVLPANSGTSTRRSTIITKQMNTISTQLPQHTITLSYTVDELWPGEVYQFVVAASNRCGIGEFSRVSDYVKMDCIAPEQPEKPEIVCIDKRQVDVRWEKPRCNGSEVLQYTLRWSQEIEGSLCPNEQTIVLLTRSIAGTKYALTGLAPGSPIQVWVSASNLVDNKLLTSLESLPSDSVITLCDVPDAPAAPSLIEPSPHTLKMTWVIPKCNGLPIDAYNITLYSENTQFGVHVRKVIREMIVKLRDLQHLGSDSTTVGYLLQYLSADTFYSATISASNSLGSSGMSAASVPVQTSPPTVPDVISAPPTVSDITPTSAVVTWKLPVHDGGAALRGFHVEYSVRCHRRVAFAQEKMESGGEITVSSGVELNATFLKPHRIYRFRVSPENRVGRASSSAWSAEFVTPSLVEFTITRYFAHRPPEEHKAARCIQCKYRVWKKAVEKEARYNAALTEVLRHWHL
ncbi:hypothetical protein PHMEG_00023965, partial [Phytophthora megakarya]